MDRRQFITTAAAIAAGTSALSVDASSNVNPGTAAKRGDSDSDYDVIVVGGGFAGVAAARDCAKNGYRTLLLEARNRLGGRTFSADFEGQPVELGGTWIHNTQPFVWAEVQRYDLDLVETPGAVPDVLYIIDGNGERQALTEEQTVEVAAGWDIYMAESRRIIPRPFDILYNKDAALRADKISAKAHLDSLQLTALQRDFNQGMIETIGHSSANQVSYLEVLRFYLLGGGCLPTFMDALARFTLRDGTVSLIHRMIEDGNAEVSLSAPVTSIHDQGDKVVVTTAQGARLSCQALINTMPMNTLGDVECRPALPEGVLAAAKLRHVGQGIKLYIKVEGDVGNISTVAPGQPLNFVMTYKQTAEYTVLVAFGSRAADLDGFSGGEIQRALDQHLPGVKVLSSTGYDWNADPYAQGTWASYRVGWLARYYDQFQQGHGRILFASGDHGEGWRGTIDGAIGSGIRAAQNVRKVLG